MSLDLIVAVLAFVLVAAIFVELARGGTSLRRLEDVAPPAGEHERPSVSVVVAARNEERHVETALRSLLAQADADGGGMEVIVVDDRSVDRTGAILERMAAEHPALRVLHVAELPAGWLGKNHALWMGARAARGELLLFTDADVVMAPGAIRRAAAHLVRGGRDHLALAPAVVMPGRLLQAFGVAFGIFFSLATRPWRVSDPRSRAHVGVGAFNLVRASAYRAMGTHRAIAMRPDDDLKLGKLVKKHGFGQEFLVGAPDVSVEWYATLGEAVDGLKKNAFAGLEYRVSWVVLATVAHAFLFLWPYVGLVVSEGPARWLYAASVVLLLLMFVGAAQSQGVPLTDAVLFPVASAVFLFVVWNATVWTLARGGIEWRGTHYPLAELRANRV